MKRVILLLLLSGCASSDYEYPIVEAKPMPEAVVAEPESEVVTVEAEPEIVINRWQKTTKAQREQWRQEAIAREEKLFEDRLFWENEWLRRSKEKELRRRSYDYVTDPNLTELEKLHQWVQNSLTSGAVHSINVEFNEVRMDPGPWSLMPIETKRIIIQCFSRYFDLQGSTERVTIRSKYSDEKLASYSVWTGIKIYK